MNEDEKRQADLQSMYNCGYMKGRQDEQKVVKKHLDAIKDAISKLQEYLKDSEETDIKTQTCPNQYTEENGQIVADKYVDFTQLDYGERFQTPSGQLYIKVNLDDKDYNAACSKDGDFMFCHFDNDTKAIRIDN